MYKLAVENYPYWGIWKGDKPTPEISLYAQFGSSQLVSLQKVVDLLNSKEEEIQRLKARMSKHYE